MRWMWVLCLVACGKEPPVVESTNDTSCEDLEVSGCDTIRSCCSEEVIFRDGVEHERRFDGCWYEHGTTIYDCLGDDCTGAEEAARASACGSEA